MEPTTEKTMPASALADGSIDASGNGHGDVAVLTLVHKDKETYACALPLPGNTPDSKAEPASFIFRKWIAASVPRWAYDLLIERQERIFENANVLMPLFCEGEPEPTALEDLPMPDQVASLGRRLDEMGTQQERMTDALVRLGEGRAAGDTVTMAATENPMAPIEERMELLEESQERILSALETLAKQRAPAKRRKKRKKPAKKTAVAASARAEVLPAELPPPSSDAESQEAADAAGPAA